MFVSVSKKSRIESLWQFKDNLCYIRMFSNNFKLKKLVQGKSKLPGRPGRFEFWSSLVLTTMNHLCCFWRRSSNFLLNKLVQGNSKLPGRSGSFEFSSYLVLTTMNHKFDISMLSTFYTFKTIFLLV